MSKWEESLQIRYRHYVETTFPWLLITDYSLLIPSLVRYPKKKRLPPVRQPLTINFYPVSFPAFAVGGDVENTGNLFVRHGFDLIHGITCITYKCIPSTGNTARDDNIPVGKCS